MGSILSSISNACRSLRLLIDTLSQLNEQYKPVLQRIDQDPGLPHHQPTAPYWLQDVPFSHLPDIQSSEFPSQADVTIIGSGITGAAIAYSLLQECERTNQQKKVTVLEARQLCSGATARNGGHIKVTPYEAFRNFRRRHSAETAADLVRFQMRHLDVLIWLCEMEGFDAECRRVETVDTFIALDTSEQAKRSVVEMGEFFPELDIRVFEAADSQKQFKMGEYVVGALSYEAGAIIPYRLVASVWNRVLKKYPSQISIETRTPVTSLDSNGTTGHPFQVHTPRGTLHSRHIIHATNAFSSSLVPGLRGKMTGLRYHMSARHPGTRFASRDGQRSWSVVYSNLGFEYLSQRPTGELMVGGGFFRSPQRGIDQMALWDDCKTDALTACHLNGIMPTVFAPHWGEDTEGERLHSVWSGIICYTSDLLPYVGKLDSRLTGRKQATKEEDKPSEWISVGYQGEGMVQAWLCGVAVAIMVMGSDKYSLPERPGIPGGRLADWFPKSMLINYGRVKRGNIRDIADF